MHGQKNIKTSYSLLLYTQKSATGSSHMPDERSPNFSTMFNIYFNIRLLFSICPDHPNDRTCSFPTPQSHLPYSFVIHPAHAAVSQSASAPAASRDTCSAQDSGNVWLTLQYSMIR